MRPSTIAAGLRAAFAAAASIGILDINRPLTDSYAMATEPPAETTGEALTVSPA